MQRGTLEEEAGLDGDFDELKYVTPASACPFYTTFLPTLHAASTQDTSIDEGGHRNNSESFAI